MSTEDIAVLKHISDTPDKLFEFITKPLSKGMQIFNIAVAVVGILGIIAIIDALFSWIKSN